ncbi:MAG: deoxyribose-phosphate aldolase [Pseudomonadota bacterium]
MPDLKSIARHALASLDLTNLNDDCDEAAIDALASRGCGEYGNVAALCVWPAFVALAKGLVGHRGVKVATVVNFPGGEEPAGEVIDLTKRCVADGADEVDMVIPYRSFMEGREEIVLTRIKRVKAAAGGAQVKAILETGVLDDPDLIRRASDLAIEAGADFIKTSTGKVPINATLSAARIMLEAIRDSEKPVGFKPAGGVKTTEQAGHYLDLCDEIMGEGWATPATFRFGASGVLDDLIATLSGEARGAAKDGY